MKGVVKMIDQEKLVEELDRLQDWLSKHEPNSDEYATVVKRLAELLKLGIDDEKAHDDQIERHDKFELEEDKLKLNRIEADEKRMAEKRQAWFELIKIGLSTMSTLALIVATGHIEQNVILGQHKWSLIPKPKI